MQTELYRSHSQLMLGGVCGGLGNYLGINATVIRLFFVLLALANGTGILLYLLLWLIVPRDPLPGTPMDADRDRSGASELAATARELGAELGHAARAPNHEATRVVGVALLILGLLLMVQNLNLSWMWWLRSDLMWPLLLIAGGAALIWRQLKGA